MKAFHHKQPSEKELREKEEKRALKQQIKELKRQKEGLVELTKRGLAPLEEIIKVLKEKEIETEVRLHRLEGEVDEKKRVWADKEEKKRQELLLLDEEYKAKRKVLKADFKKREQEMEEKLRKKEQDSIERIKKREGEAEEKHREVMEARQEELDAVLCKKQEMEERIALLEKEFHSKKKWFDILHTAHEKSKVDLDLISSGSVILELPNQLPVGASATHPQGSLEDRKDSDWEIERHNRSASTGSVHHVVSCWGLDVSRFKRFPALLLDIQLAIASLLPSDTWSFVQESTRGDEAPLAQLALAEVSGGTLSMKYALATAVNHKKKIAPVVICLLAKQRASASVSEALRATQEFLTEETKAPIVVLTVDGDGTHLLSPTTYDDNADNLKALSDFLSLVAQRGTDEENKSAI